MAVVFFNHSTHNVVMENHAASLDLFPRRYAQSTSGLSSSHLTEPEDSRSILIHKLSPHGLYPYEMLRKCPYVVSHLDAKFSRSIIDNFCKYSLSVMNQVYTIQCIACQHQLVHLLNVD